MSKDLNIIGLQPTMEIAPTQLTIGATSTANELKLETTYNNLLENGSTIFTTVGGITTPHVVGTVVKTQGTAPVTTTKTITGNTTTINNSPFNNSTVPTLGNMIIISNTARAIADNASATTFNFNLSSGNDILELQPSMKILLESIEIDPSSTTSSLVLNSPYNNYIVDGTPLILDQAGIVTQVITGTVVKTATTTPTNVTFTITGATTSLPTLYAFNSSNVTVNNMTIASNVATATANSASATTFEYTASGDVTEIEPIAILQPTELDIDPSSTTGSIKVNYATNNLLQVGSKVLVTDGGVTTEQTIAAGSQAANSFIDSGWGTLLALGIPSGKLFLVGQSNGKIAVSTDDGQNWQYAGQPIVGAVHESIASIVEFGGNYYSCWGVTGQTTVTIFKSVDLLNWTSVYTYSATIARKAHLATNGVLLRVALFSATAGDAIYLYGSSDGNTWASITTFSGVAGHYLYQFCFISGKWLLCGNSRAYYSDDGSSFVTYNPGTSGGILALSYIAGLYVMYTYTSIGGGVGIYSSANFSTWTFRQPVPAPEGNFFFNNSTTIYLAGAGATTIYYSANATTWATQTTLSNNAFNGAATDDAIVIGIPSSQNINYKYQSNAWTNGATASGYQFTITSPSLPVPDAMYLGGQVLQSNVGGAGWVTHTVTYSDSSGTITFTGNNRTGLTGDTVQVRMTGINNTEVLSYFRGNLVVETADGYTYTCSAFDTPLTSVPVKAYKGGQTLLSSCTATNTPSLVAVSSYTYTRSGDIITYTGNNRTGLAGLYVQLRAATLNENDILTYFGYTYLSLDPTSGWTYTCTNINPRLTTLPGDVYYGDQQVQTNVELAGWQTHAVSEIVSIAANTFRVAYTSISSEPGKDVQLRVQDLAEEDEVSRMKLTITQD